MKPLVKTDFQLFRDQVDNWGLATTKLFMDEQTAIDLGFVSDYDIIRDELVKLKNPLTVKDVLIYYMRNNPVVLKDIIEKEFPQYLDMLNKLLILK